MVFNEEQKWLEDIEILAKILPVYWNDNSNDES